MIDRVNIIVKSGNGGNGCKSFRREKHVPRGGPNGGDGGRGGSIYLLEDRNINTLLAFRYKQRFATERGGHGQGSNKHGKQVIKDGG